MKSERENRFVKTWMPERKNAHDRAQALADRFIIFMLIFAAGTAFGYAWCWNALNP